MENNTLSENRIHFLREANALLQNNRFLEVLNLVAEQLRNYPADADLLGIYGEALIGMGRLKELHTVLNTVEQIISGFNLIYERAGDACREKGFHRDAAYCYEKFIALRPDAEKSRDILEKMTYLEQADQVSDGASFTDDQNIPEQEEFYTVTMAQLYIEQGHYHDAEVILKEIIKKEPRHAQAKAMLDELSSSRGSESVEKDQSLQNSKVIAILYSWLKNIERMKTDGAER